MSDQNQNEPGADAPSVTADKPKTKKAGQPKVKPENATSEAPKGKQLPVDAYGFHVSSLKSKAAALYGSKNGATVAEVKAATGSLQLNLLKQLEKDGFTVKRVKENGPAGRSVTRYFVAK